MSTKPEQMRRPALTNEDQRLPARNDADTFRLQPQFIRTHGVSRGQLTTLITTSVEGGVFLCADWR